MIQAVACLTFSISVMGPFSLLVFAVLKVYVHVFVYTKIKYEDDGRDYVSFKEYLAIHVTFSILYSCLSYYVAYSISLFVKDFITKHNYFMLDYNTLNVLLMLCFEVEMVIYLTYYKDVIFALITLTNFVGMYINMKQIPP